MSIILVVEDEEHLRNLLRMSLERIGHDVVAAPDGVEAIKILRTRIVNLVLLDIMMPRVDGFQVCQEIRKLSDVPIVMLTAINRPDDIARALEIGADDYITKPFSFAEIEARIEAVLRRMEWIHKPPDLDIIVTTDIKLNHEKKEVLVRGHPVHLSPTEYGLLRHLMLHANQTVPHDKLMESIWGFPSTGKAKILHTNVRRLREKIERNPAEPRYVVTVLGIGYKFCGDGNPTQMSAA